MVVTTRIKLSNTLPTLGLALLFSSVLILDSSLADHLYSSSRFYLYGGALLFALSLLAAKVRSFAFNWADASCLLFGAYVLLLYWLKGSMATNRLLELALLLALYFGFRLFFSARLANKEHMALSVGSVLLSLLGCAVAVWGLAQLYGYSQSQHHLFLLTGPFYNPGPFAGFLAVIFPLAFFNALRCYPATRGLGSWKELKGALVSGKGWQLVGFALSALSYLCIMLVLPAARSRAAWLAAGGGAMLVALFHYRSHLLTLVQTWSLRMRWFIGTALCLLLVGGGMWLYGFKKNSADGRSLIWKVSMSLVREHPLCGTGLGSFAGVYGPAQINYFKQGMATEQEQWVAGSPEYAFNEYVQLAVELGLLGLLLFVMLLVATVRQAMANWHALLGVAASLLAFLIFAAFSYPFTVLPFGLVLSYLLAALNTPKSGGEQKQACATFTVWGIKLLVMAVLLVLLPWQYGAFQAYKTWKACAYYGTSKQQECFKSIYPVLHDQQKFLFEYGQALSRQGQYTLSNEVLRQGLRFSCDPMFHNIMGKNFQALKEYEAAEEAFKRACYMVPERLYPYYLLALMYQESGQHAKAVELASYVINKDPKIQSTAVREMKEEMEKMKSEK